MGAFAPLRIAITLNVEESKRSVERKDFTHLFLVPQEVYGESRQEMAKQDDIVVLNIHNEDRFNIENFSQFATFLGSLRP